ncbi:MAG: PAS domain-containing protein [Bernardetiaceae bacterium]|jgi:hypothetical protein|nr:PAS domain-containing protein [Bernardetiaceae bacterium]
MQRSSSSEETPQVPVDTQQLLAELAHLRAENANLMRQLGLSGPAPTPITNGTKPLAGRRIPRGLIAYSLDNTQELIYWFNAQADILYANEAVSRVLGYTQAELSSLPISDFYIDYRPDRWRRFWEELRRLEKFTYEWYIRAKNGSELPVEISANYIHFGDLEYCCAIVRVVTERRKAEDKIRFEQEYKNAIWQAVPDLMLLMNSRGVYLDMRGGSRYPGPPDQSLIGTSVFESNLPDTVKTLLHENNKKAIATGEVQTAEYSIPFYNNTQLRYFESRAVKCGRNKVLLLIRDITDRKESEAQAQIEAEKRAALLKAIPDIIMVMSRRGDCIDFKGGNNFKFVPPDAWVGTNITDGALPFDLAQKILDHVARAIDTNQVHCLEYDMMLSDGQLHHFESRAVRYGKNLALRIVRDITDRRLIEERVRQKEEQQRAILSAIPDNIFIMNEAGDYLEFVEGDGATFIPSAQIVGSNIKDAQVTPSVVELIMGANRRAIETGVPQTIEYKLFADGADRYYESRSVRYTANQALRIVREITQKKQNELDRDRLANELQRLNQELSTRQEELNQNLQSTLALKREVERQEAYYKALVESSPDLIMRVSNQLVIEYIHTLEYPDPASLVGKTVQDLTTPENWSLVKANYQRLFETGQPQQFEYQYVNQEGQPTFLQIYQSLIKDTDESQPAAFVVGRNITASRLAAQQIEDTRRNLRATIDNSLQNTVLLDAGGRVILADHKFIAKFKEHYNIDMQPGRPFVECLTTDELKADFVKHFAEIKRKKSIFRYEAQFATAPSGHAVWYDVTYSPVLGANQELLAVVIAQLDITKRKEDEERLLKMNEVLVTQNTRLNHYSYVVSHNLRAPVASLLGLINLLELQGLVNDQNREVLGFIRESAQGLDTVIRDLNRILSETRAMEEQKVYVDFAHETEMVKSLLAMEIQRNNVTVKTDFGAVPGVSSIKSFLSSIFLNLISNAIKYHKPGRSPVITLTSRAVPESPQLCCLTFADNGLGMDLAVQGDHLFKLYRRFHDHVDGKGMGLYLVKTQVEMLGGKIEVESQVNKGTQFHIYLKEK